MPGERKENLNFFGIQIDARWGNVHVAERCVCMGEGIP
jgi:hypothetical protein